MLELTGECFAPNLRVWFGDVESETFYRYRTTVGHPISNVVAQLVEHYSEEPFVPSVELRQFSA